MADQTNVARKLERLRELFGQISAQHAGIRALWFDAASIAVDLFNDPGYRARLGDMEEDEIGNMLDAELPLCTPLTFWQFREMLEYFPQREQWEQSSSLVTLYEDMLEQKCAPDPDAPRRTCRRVTIAEYEALERERDAATKAADRLDPEWRQADSLPVVERASRALRFWVERYGSHPEVKIAFQDVLAAYERLREPQELVAAT